VHEHVDRTAGGGDGVDDGLCRLRVLEVGRDGKRVGIVRPQQRQRRIRRRSARAVGESDPITGAGELARDALRQAGRCARDEREPRTPAIRRRRIQRDDSRGAGWAATANR
jgi:hypothetical protein